MNRRSFLAFSALLPAAGLTPRLAHSRPAPAFRTLGRTGLKVSEVGMGFMLTSDPDMVRSALDAGINYFDTARSYMGGQNEGILGKGLKGVRGEAIVATKCHHLGRKQRAIASVEQSLKALEIDVIDVLQLHSLASRRQVLLEDHIEAVEELRKAGKIRYAGVSTHSNMIEVMEAAMEAKVYDVVLTSFNFKSAPELTKSIGKTAAAGIGVVAMKIMAGGYATVNLPGLNPYQGALRWVLQHASVSTTIPSMTTFEQIRENTAVMGTKHTWRDDAALRMYALSVDRRYCRACGSCDGTCPRGADVPTAMRGLMYAEGYRRPSLGKQTLRDSKAKARLPCATCITCTVTCRFGLDVPSRMAAAARLAGTSHA